MSLPGSTIFGGVDTFRPVQKPTSLSTKTETGRAPTGRHGDHWLCSTDASTARLPRPWICRCESRPTSLVKSTPTSGKRQTKHAKTGPRGQRAYEHNQRDHEYRKDRPPGAEVFSRFVESNLSRSASRRPPHPDRDRSVRLSCPPVSRPPPGPRHSILPRPSTPP